MRRTKLELETELQSKIDTIVAELRKTNPSATTDEIQEYVHTNHPNILQELSQDAKTELAIAAIADYIEQRLHQRSAKA